MIHSAFDFTAWAASTRGRLAWRDAAEQLDDRRVLNVECDDVPGEGSDLSRDRPSPDIAHDAFDRVSRVLAECMRGEGKGGGELREVANTYRKTCVASGCRRGVPPGKCEQLIHIKNVVTLVTIHYAVKTRLCGL